MTVRRPKRGLGWATRMDNHVAGCRTRSTRCLLGGIPPSVPSGLDSREIIRKTKAWSEKVPCEYVSGGPNPHHAPSYTPRNHRILSTSFPCRYFMRRVLKNHIAVPFHAVRQRSIRCTSASGSWSIPKTYFMGRRRVRGSFKTVSWMLVGVCKCRLATLLEDKGRPGPALP